MTETGSVVISSFCIKPNVHSRKDKYGSREGGKTGNKRKMNKIMLYFLYLLIRIYAVEVCPSLPQDKLARDDAQRTKAGY